MQTIIEWYIFSMSIYDASQNEKINIVQQREHQCLFVITVNDPFLFLITAMPLLLSLKNTFPRNVSQKKPL